MLFSTMMMVFCFFGKLLSCVSLLLITWKSHVICVSNWFFFHGVVYICIVVGIWIYLLVMSVDMLADCCFCINRVIHNSGFAWCRWDSFSLVVITKVMLWEVYDLVFTSCACGVCYLKREVYEFDKCWICFVCGKDMFLGGGGNF